MSAADASAREPAAASADGAGGRGLRGVLAAAHGAARSRRGKWTAGDCCICRDPDQSALFRQPRRHHSAGGGRHRRDSASRRRRRRLPRAELLSRPQPAPGAADLPLGFPRRRRGLHGDHARRAARVHRRYRLPPQRQPAGLRLFHDRPLHGVSLVLDPARHSRGDRRGGEARRRARRSGALAGGGALAHRALCHNPGAAACPDLLRRHLLCHVDGRIRHSLHLGDEYRRIADDNLYRVHAQRQFCHGRELELGAGVHHLAGAGAGAQRRGLGGGSRRMTRTGSFYAQLAVTALIGAFLIVPVILSVVAGLTVNFFQGLKSGLTLRWIGEVWSLYSGTVYLSLLVAFACLGATLLLGVPAAYVLAKRQSRWTRLVEELLMLPVAVPGLATALALILLYGGFREFRTSWHFILVGHVLFTLPFMVRAVLAVLTSIDLATLEEGASSLGARFAQRFFGIVLPNCRSGILAGG